MRESSSSEEGSTHFLTNASKKNRDMPWMDGNEFATKHGFYSEKWSEEEKAERKAWIQQMIEEKGNPTFAERALITTASGLNTIIARAFKAIEEGRGAPAHEHLLAIVNSFRLIMCALGLEKRGKRPLDLKTYLEQKAKEGASR